VRRRHHLAREEKKVSDEPARDYRDLGQNVQIGLTAAALALQAHQAGLTDKVKDKLTGKPNDEPADEWDDEPADEWDDEPQP